MLHYYCWNTQNARKAAIFFEETQLAHKIVPVSLFDSEQKKPIFININPNGRIPALVDDEFLDSTGKPLTVFESGCVLQYIAEKTAAFLPQNYVDRYEVLSWLHWQMSGLGPTLGQFAHFSAVLAKDSGTVNSLLKMHCASEIHPYAIERFYQEALRLLQVLDTQLNNKNYLCGEYSIADMAIFPWVESVWPGLLAVDTELNSKFNNIARWLALLLLRPAIQKTLKNYAWETDFKSYAAIHNASL